MIDLTSAVTLIQNDPDNKRLEQLKQTAVGIVWGVVSVASQGVINRHDIQQSETESLFTRWNTVETKRQQFRDELESVVQEAGGSLVILLDELDRCMPQQALDYLNVVRHLFDVEGVTVVIGVNRRSSHIASSNSTERAATLTDICGASGTCPFLYVSRPLNS